MVRDRFVGSVVSILRVVSLGVKLHFAREPLPDGIFRSVIGGVLGMGSNVEAVCVLGVGDFKVQVIHMITSECDQ